MKQVVRFRKEELQSNRISCSVIRLQHERLSPRGISPQSLTTGTMGAPAPNTRAGGECFLGPDRHHIYVSNGPEQQPPNAWAQALVRRIVAERVLTKQARDSLRFRIARDIKVIRQVGHIPAEMLSRNHENSAAAGMEVDHDVLYDPRLEQLVYVRTIASRSRIKGLIQGIEVLSKLRQIEDSRKNRGS